MWACGAFMCLPINLNDHAYLSFVVTIIECVICDCNWPWRFETIEKIKINNYCLLYTLSISNQVLLKLYATKQFFFLFYHPQTVNDIRSMRENLTHERLVNSHITTHSFFSFSSLLFRQQNSLTSTLSSQLITRKCSMNDIEPTAFLLFHSLLLCVCEWVCTHSHALSFQIFIVLWMMHNNSHHFLVIWSY